MNIKIEWYRGGNFAILKAKAGLIMKQTIKIIVWSLVSLMIFLVLNYLMQLPAIGMGSHDLLRTNLVAGALFGVPLLLTICRLRIGFYLLALVQILYSVGYLNAIYKVITASNPSIISKSFVILIIVIGLAVNVYWFVLAWKFRKATTQERVKRYMKYRK